MKFLIRILIYGLLILFPFGLLFRFKIGTNVYVAPQDIVAFLLLIVLSIYYFKHRKAFEFGKFYLFQLLFLITGTISLFLNAYIFKDINIIVSMLYALRYISYLSILSIGQFFNDDRYVKNLFFLSASAFVALGFIQYITFNDLRSLFYLGWDDHLYRLVSTLFDPNFSALTYVLLFFVFMSKVIKQTLFKSYISLIFSFFTVIMLYLTFSRTGLIALVGGVLALIIQFRKYYLILLAAVAFFIILLTVSDTKIEGLNPLRTVSTSERLKSIVEAGELIKKSPLIGSGFNAFRYTQVRYGIRNPLGASMSNSDAGTDNSFLFVMATTGIVGSIFYILSWYYLLKRLLVEGSEKKIFIGMFVSLLIGSLFINALFYTPILLLMFLILSLRNKIIYGL